MLNNTFPQFFLPQPAPQPRLKWHQRPEWHDFAGAAGMALLGNIGNPTAFTDAMAYGLGAMSEGRSLREQQELEARERQRVLALEMERLQQQRKGWAQRDQLHGFKLGDRKRLEEQLKLDAEEKAAEEERRERERESLREALAGRDESAINLALAEYDRTGSMLAAMQAADGQYPAPQGPPQIENRGGVLYEVKDGSYRLIGQAPRPPAPDKPEAPLSMLDRDVQSLADWYYKGLMDQDPSRDAVAAMQEAGRMALAYGQQGSPAPGGGGEPQTAEEATQMIRQELERAAASGQLSPDQVDTLWREGTKRLNSLLLSGMSPAQAYQELLRMAAGGG